MHAGRSQGDDAAGEIGARPPRGVFYRVRVAFLLAVLAVVVMYAWNDIAQRKERNQWNRTLNVAFVILQLKSVPDPVIERFRERTAVLEERLAEEFTQYRGHSIRPFRFSVYGPMPVETTPPKVDGDGTIALLRHNYILYRYRRRVNHHVGLEPAAYDSVIYVAATPVTGGPLQWVEGVSQQGGRVGIVEVELDESMVDLALFVATHELFHTLGASDKYDASGRSLVPHGFAEPDLSPLYPQRGVEIMARNRPTSPSTEEPPRSLDDLFVNPFTAKEIGW